MLRGEEGEGVVRAGAGVTGKAGLFGGFLVMVDCCAVFEVWGRWWGDGCVVHGGVVAGHGCLIGGCSGGAYGR